MAVDVEAETQATARRLAALAGEGGGQFEGSWLAERLLGWAMSHPSFKTQLFRFVDVFPAAVDDDDALRHIEEYFADAHAPWPFDVALGVAEHLPFGSTVSAAVARRTIRRMATQFILADTASGAVAGARSLRRSGSAVTVDLLGEKTVTATQADRYAARVQELLETMLDDAPGWETDPHLDADDLGPIPRVNVSVKPTALAPSLSPLTGEAGLVEAVGRLAPILSAAARRGATVHFDMEHGDAKELTLELFRRCCEQHPLLDAGVVVQAYRRDSYADLEQLARWTAALGRRVTVRLVKGAYWDAETIRSRAEGWPSPVFDRKAETDANYERCTDLLHRNHGLLRAAFGTHNLRSIGHAVASARAAGIPDDGFEIQMLHGMAEPLQRAVRESGLRLRVYAPVGELVPGMAYLVRRLLENTSNESFVRLRFTEHHDLDELLAPPETGSGAPTQAASEPVPVERHEPLAEWRRPEVRQAFGAAVASTEARLDDEPRPDEPPSDELGAAEAAQRLQLHRESRRKRGSRGPIAVPAVIGGERVGTTSTLSSVDPAKPSRMVAVSASCGVEEADAAVAAARDAQPAWAARPAEERAGVLRRAAAWLRERRNEIAAMEVFEVGKPWAHADADVCEAIDFCEYYADGTLRLARGGEVRSPPGESNTLHYGAMGVGLVIAPWNFPLAIPTGMTVAALVMGNAVVLKPAEQSPAVASYLVAALEHAGMPHGVLSFLPGRGEVVGAHLVAHPEIAFVAFTGSSAVGLAIVREAAVHRPGQRQVKRVVAEMGGKNAIVVDADADLDTAVPDIVTSAFGYAGQKCSAASRLVVLDAVHDELVERLVGATNLLRIGHPADMATQVGPLIDAEAYERVRSYVALARDEGEVVIRRDDVPAEGWFVGPTIVDGVGRGARLVTEEIFGPVLAIQRADDLDEALELANDTAFALTAGILSRSPANVRRASAELRAGVVYVNRPITGATVGRQPFGGHGLSGVGSMAGGPDYLLQFAVPRTVSENTLRQGFAPE